jgi:hypothetical protein
VDIDERRRNHAARCSSARACDVPSLPRTIVNAKRYIPWLGKFVEVIPGVSYHASGEATAPRILSRRDNLVHLQRPGLPMALCLCERRYNIYRRPGMRGHKGIPTAEPVTCLVCIDLENEL